MSPRHSQAQSIPILTDIVSRGAGVPNDADIDMVLTPDDEAAETLGSPYDIGSEEPTVLPIPPEVKAKQQAEKSFSLDELTDVPIPAEGDGETNEIIEQAVSSIMPQLESMVRESLESILAEKGIESPPEMESEPEPEPDKENNKD